MLLGNPAHECFLLDVSCCWRRQSKLRLDAYLTARLPEVSRSQLQHGIKLGLVKVNGRVFIQNSKVVRPGDVIICELPPPPVTNAIPQVGAKERDRQDKLHCVARRSACHLPFLRRPSAALHHVECSRILQLPAPHPVRIRSQDIPLDIVFEDDHLLVINKV